MTNKLLQLFLLIYCIPGLVGIILEGSHTSFAQYHQWHGGANTSLELEFQTKQDDALLLYTDHKMSKEYMQLTVVNGTVRLRYNFGGHASGLLNVARGDQKVNDGRWHQLAILRMGDQVTIMLDRVFRSTSSSSYNNHYKYKNSKTHFFDASVFGNSTSNSFVYVGGIPSWYSGEKSEELVLPQVILEPRLRGGVKRLRYQDAIHGKRTFQDMMAFKGVRTSTTVNACDHRNPCQNRGECVPTDSGPICDCSKIEFEGELCEKAAISPEITLVGGEYLTYNFLQKDIDPILSFSDEISLEFRTRRPSGLLFYSGNERDYLALSLTNGVVNLQVQLGDGKLETKIAPQNVFFNDNKWHKVQVRRNSEKVTLTVDNVYKERWITKGSFTVLASNNIFVGGSESNYKLGEATAPIASTLNTLSQDGGDEEAVKSRFSYNNWVGCLKKVVFKADSLILDVLTLAQDGNPLVSVIGDVEWRCRDIGLGTPQAFTSDMTSYYEAQKRRQGGVISFTREEAYLILPSWKVNLSGSIAFKFRTNEDNGLLLFNAGGGPENDYFAMEILRGHLYVHLDLGSGSIKIRASRTKLNDGNWHHVELTIKRKNGRITIDGDTESFETPGDANQLDLQGNLYIGSVDYMDPYLRLPPSLWSTTLKYGFVGCFKELYINGASYDVVKYAHEQDVGSIRSSCHKMPGQCHDRPCMHGGKCKEGWNRYLCDCSQTSFSGATCGNAATTMKFEGTNSMSLNFKDPIVTETDELLIRFRSRELNGILVTTSHDRSQDRIEITLDDGRIKILIQIATVIKTFFAGKDMNDDIYHSMRLIREGTKVEITVDDEEPILGDLHGSESIMSYSKIFIGNSDPSELLSSPLTSGGFVGSLQQFSWNGRNFFEMASTGQLMNHKMDAILVETHSPEETVHHAVSFTAQNTYVGLPQMKAYNSINIRFQFRTFEPNGLIMYNAGKASDFIAIELINGRMHYILNLGYGHINIKDNALGSLADNKWHRVIIGRPSRYRHTLVVDGHVATTSIRGDNYYLDLDGILYLGGVRDSMYKTLPRPLMSKSGFQGCFSSFETNGELLDPVRHALVPSPLVEEGCEDSVSYEWGSSGGVVSYDFPDDKRPDTNNDMLSLGFITPSFDAVLVRVDSHRGNEHNDYLELEIVAGKVFVNYNLGSKDIRVGDLETKINDGKYHVVRFTRTGANSTLQIDDQKPQTASPQGNRHLTVFNDQASIQIGGLWNSMQKARLLRPFRGVIAGVLFNGLRPLDLAASGKDSRANVKGDVSLLENIPFDYREKKSHLFTEDAIKAMMDKVYESRGNAINAANGNEGSRYNEIDTGNQVVLENGAGKASTSYLNCDDEEDCYGASGSGDGPIGEHSDENDEGHVWYPGGTDIQEKENYETTSLTTASYFNDYSTTTDWVILIYPPSEAPPQIEKSPDVQSITILPFPDEYEDNDGDERSTIKEYDAKWNTGEEPVEDIVEEITERPSKESKSMPGTMVLVIGIILGAFVAMVLIVIIVLKMRTRVDGEIKTEESSGVMSGGSGAAAAPRYQFAAPNDYGEVSGRAPVGAGADPGQPPPPFERGPSEEEPDHRNTTATTSLMEGGRSQNNNGFFGANCSLNGERSRLFRKANWSKPVREWYV